ncbi:MAG: TetR/AcrR family transcriptional regulator [Proteobacteria bacterium]|nr:TetR/AcrR family transcriptional regulator [Pseudomonadota bacterium]
MPAARHRATAAPTRERIVTQAERLIAAKGVYGFTLRDIAAPLGVQVPAIYKHYKSRDDVLIEVSRRYIGQLATQFAPRPGLAPAAALRSALKDFVDLMMLNPAYARLALVDFATPGGGMEYVKLAAGGSFQDNFMGGPLAAMHRRLQALLADGIRAGAFRRVAATDLYRLVKAALLIRLVFPDDAPLARRPSAAEVRAAQRWLWDIASRYLAPDARRAVR